MSAGNIRPFACPCRRLRRKVARRISASSSPLDLSHRTLQGVRP